jgi:1-acyl-sn-glycerol-3-phosphate acyltransferase
MNRPVARTLIGWMLSPFIRKVTGLENIPKEGRYIFAANHASYLDHFLIGCTVAKKARATIHFLAKKEHFDDSLQKIWHSYLNAIPVDRQKGGKEGLLAAIKSLEEGDIIFIYPEGTRTLTGKMNRAKTGVARLAIEAKAAVIPIGATDTFSIMPKGKYVPKFGRKTDINIGKPMTFEAYYDKEDKETMRKVTTMIAKEIARLAEKDYPFDEEYL